MEINAREYLKTGEAEALVVSDKETGEIIGGVGIYTDGQGDQETHLVGSTGKLDGNGNIVKNKGARVGGSYVLVDTENIALGLNDPNISNGLVVAGLAENGEAMLGTLPPPPDAYHLEAQPSTFAGQIASQIGTGAWVDIGSSLIIEEELEANNYSFYISVFMLELGGVVGTVDVGVGKNGEYPTQFKRFNIDNLFRSTISLNILGNETLEGNEEFRVWVRGAGSAIEYNLNINGTIKASTLKIQEINPQIGIIKNLVLISAGKANARVKEFSPQGNNPTEAELDSLFPRAEDRDLAVFVKDSPEDDVWTCFYNSTSETWYYEKLLKAN